MSISTLHVTFIGVVAFYSCVSFWLFNKVYNTVHTVIDEEFHVPQGLAYCNFNFTAWNPKITTLPGLYLLSAVILGPFKLCTTYWLRFINYIGGIVNLCLFFVLFSLIDKKGNEDKKLPALFTSFNLAILPPLFFFTNLYYTDIVSMTFILLLVIFNKLNMHFHASLCGLFSVIIRQTNIIWVGMLCVDYMLKQIHYYCRKCQDEKVTSFEVTEKDLLNFCTLENILYLRNIPLKILMSTYAYVVTIMIFLAFLVLNGGIVVGDKTAHVAVIHVPQLFYFSLFCLVFSWPHFLNLIIPFLKDISKEILGAILLIALMILIVHYNTLVHPYLLADNRHYTFYIWNRFYQNIIGFRYVVTPVYFFGMYSILRSIYSKNDVTFALTYIPCTIVVLILQKMIEVRYFLIPFVLLRSRIRCISYKLLFMEMITYLLINIVTLSIFFRKDIYWTDFDYVQKLIW